MSDAAAFASSILEHHHVNNCFSIPSQQNDEGSNYDIATAAAAAAMFKPAY